MNTFPISLRGTTPSVGVGWVGSGDGTGRDRSFGDRIPIGKIGDIYIFFFYVFLIASFPASLKAVASVSLKLRVSFAVVTTIILLIVSHLLLFVIYIFVGFPALFR